MQRWRQKGRERIKERERQGNEQRMRASEQSHLKYNRSIWGKRTWIIILFLHQMINVIRG